MKKLSMFAVLISALALFVTFPAYAEDATPLIENLDIEQGLILVGIGIFAAVVTSFEGWNKSGLPFDVSKFVIAIKRAAITSIGATLSLLVFYPNPSGFDYVAIAIAVILGVKMIHTSDVQKIVAQIPKIFAKELENKILAKTGMPKAFSDKEVVSKQYAVMRGQFTAIRPPQLAPVNEWYQNNFIKNKDKGNTLKQGEDLWVRIIGVRSFVSVQLKDSKGKIIQIDQSHPLDEDGDIETTRLETAHLSKGKYKLKILGDRGSSDTQGIKSDEFTIV